MSHPSVYRAKAVSVGRGSIEAFVPQVFGETSITITEAMGALPDAPMMGWVFFQAGNCEFPVWAGVGSGGDGVGGGADEVWIGNDAPTDAFKELWYDPDAPAPGSDEIWIGPDDPDALATGFELWYDTDATPVSPPWINMSALFASPWTHYSAPYGPVMYRKKEDEVQLRGLVQGGTAGSTIANLLPGYRPNYDPIFNVSCGTGVAEVRVSAAGVVVYQQLLAGTYAGWLSLSQVRFSTI